MQIRTEIRPGDIGRIVELHGELYARAYGLDRTSELKAAAHLYRRAGFTPTERKTHDIWGAPHTEERYDLELN